MFDLQAAAKLLIRKASVEPGPGSPGEVPVQEDGTDFLQTRLPVTGYDALPGGKGSFVDLEPFTGPPYLGDLRPTGSAS